MFFEFCAGSKNQSSHLLHGALEAIQAVQMARGLGMTYLDQRMVGTAPQCNDFKALEFVSFAKIPLTFGLYHRKGKQLSMGANHFIEVCAAFSFQ